MTELRSILTQRLDAVQDEVKLLRKEVVDAEAFKKEVMAFAEERIRLLEDATQEIVGEELDRFAKYVQTSTETQKMEADIQRIRDAVNTQLSAATTEASRVEAQVSVADQLISALVGHVEKLKKPELLNVTEIDTIKGQIRQVALTRPPPVASKVPSLLDVQSAFQNPWQNSK
jgi:uncharacterized protein YdbL (DUF1318 family)